jgi:hypothetical protein
MPACRSHGCDRLAIDSVRQLPTEVVVDADALKLASRSIRQWTGAFAESAYFAREAHERFEALGLGPPAGAWRDVVVGTPTTFHAARVAALGDVVPELAIAVFPQMAPRAVAAAAERLRQVSSPAQVIEARGGGAHASLQRILGPEADGIELLAVLLRGACDAVTTGGRPFAAALLGHGWTGDPLADARHAAEVLREVRGDAHNATWLGRGFTAPQIHILTEHWYGLTGCGFRHVWGWTRAELDAAAQQLVDAGFTDSDGLTKRGRDVREEIEDATDEQMLPVMAEIEDALDDLARIAEPISRAVVAGRGALMARPSYFTWLASQPAYQYN